MDTVFKREDAFSNREISGMSWGNYIYSRELHLAYVEIPKCACTSIKMAMARYSKPDMKVEDIRTGIYDVCEDVPFYDSIPLDTFRFTFIRNPLYRFFSFYRDKVFMKDCEITKNLLIPYGMNINDVIDIIVEQDPETVDFHLRPQHFFIFREDKMSYLNFVGKVERMESDWCELITKIGFDLKLEHYNKTLSQLFAEISFDAEHIKKLRKYYADDFRLLGYK